MGNFSGPLGTRAVLREWGHGLERVLGQSLLACSLTQTSNKLSREGMRELGHRDGV